MSMMRVVAPVLLAVLLAAPASANTAPGWNDVPALIAFATQSVDKELRGCSKRTPPWDIALIATRDPKTGATKVAMPFPNVGHRGFTAEEKCLMAAVPKIALPDLPAGIDRIVVGHTVVADGATAPSPDKAFDTWKDPAATLASFVDDKAKASLAACDKKARTVRVILDLSHGKTRVWLPAWQFHSAKGDGSTPAAEAKVKACVNKVIATWKPTPLPKQMAEMQLAISVAP
ncbi:MAG TPA: hypothetical protein VMZ53_08960 [Kofleriaceae bacterium]|nr:hypothetical protein [Kofleriaceae bacterium]